MFLIGKFLLIPHQETYTNTMKWILPIQYFHYLIISMVYKIELGKCVQCRQTSKQTMSLVLSSSLTTHGCITRNASFFWSVGEWIHLIGHLIDNTDLSFEQFFDGSCSIKMNIAFFWAVIKFETDTFLYCPQKLWCRRRKMKKFSFLWDIVIIFPSFKYFPSDL